MYLSLERRGLRGTQAEGTASSQGLAEGHLGSDVSASGWHPCWTDCLRFCLIQQLHNAVGRTVLPIALWRVSVGAPKCGLVSFYGLGDFIGQ